MGRKFTDEEIAKIIERGKKDAWFFYVDTLGEWRWQRVAPNGRIVGASSEGYNNKYDCMENAIRNGYRGE